jgi:hypothetical protein
MRVRKEKTAMPVYNRAATCCNVLNNVVFCLGLKDPFEMSLSYLGLVQALCTTFPQPNTEKLTQKRTDQVLARDGDDVLNTTAEQQKMPTFS